MMQPFFLKLGGEHRSAPHQASPVCITCRRLAGVASPLSFTSKKPEWQIVVGNRVSNGFCAEHRAKTKRFPLTCANRFFSLECEKEFDVEEFYSASDDVDEDSAADSAEAKQLSSKGRKQVVTCSQGGIFGVPEQLSVCPPDLELPGQTVSAGVVLDLVLSDKELHAPFHDDGLWLTEAPAGKDAEGGTLSSNKAVALGEDDDITSLSTELSSSD
eukprot:4929333-Amphidinium_carterae.1